MAKFEKGHPKLPGAGRPPGSPDRYTRLKHEFMKAFEQLGGTQRLIEWATQEENQRDFYRMIVQILPKSVEVRGDAEAPLTIVVRKMDGGNESGG